MRIHRLTQLLATLVIFSGLGAPNIASAIDLFVDPAGVNSANCTDQAKPCATIEHVLSQAVFGDRVFLAPFDTTSSGAGGFLPGSAIGSGGKSCSIADRKTYFESNLFAIESIELIGGGRNCTIIDAQGTDRIISFVNSGGGSPGTSKVSGITFANGSAPTEFGGAILFTFGSLTVASSRFENNQASFGGAIGAKSSAGTLTIRDSVFERNTADTGGGAVGCVPCDELSIARSRFVRNWATWLGGAIMFDTEDVSEDIVIRRSHFVDNTSGLNGGALSIFGVDGVLDIVVENTLFQRNVALDGDGGAIQVSGALTLDGATFDSNEAGVDGGAVSLLNAGNDNWLNAYNSTFSRNSAERGGALSASGEAIGYLSFNTFVGNLASNPSYGDHISGVWGFLDVYHTIIADDPTGAGVADRACERVATSGARNLVVDGTCGGWIGFNQGVPTGIAASLSAGTGPATVHELLPGSNALDAGADFALHCSERGTPKGLVVDQRDLNRRVDYDGDGISACDIGSVEMESP